MLLNTAMDKSHIDMERCVRHSFKNAEAMTPEQRTLAEDLIESGPPGHRQVTIKLSSETGLIKWNNEAKTLTRNGVTVTLKWCDPLMLWSALDAAGN
jgi:hypothetical protein